MNKNVPPGRRSAVDAKTRARRERTQAIALAESGVGVVGVRLEDKDGKEEEPPPAANAGVSDRSGDDGKDRRRGRSDAAASAGGFATASSTVVRRGAPQSANRSEADRRLASIKNSSAATDHLGPHRRRAGGRSRRDPSASPGAAAVASPANAGGMQSERDEPTDPSLPGAHRDTYGRGRLAVIKAAHADGKTRDQCSGAKTPREGTGAEFLGDDDPLQKTDKTDKSDVSGLAGGARVPIVAEVGDRLPDDDPSGDDEPQRRSIDPTVPYSDLNLTNRTGSGHPHLPSNPVESFPHYPLVHEDANVAEAEEGLAVATVVGPEEREGEEEAYAAIQTAYVPEPLEKVPFRKTRRCRIFATVGSCLIIAAVVGSVVGTLFGGNGGGGEGPVPTPEPTVAPTPVAFTMTVPQFLEEEVAGPKINDAGTPYNMALEWITDEDPMNLTTRDIIPLTQRYLLAVLYFSTIREGGNGWTHCGKDTSMDNCTFIEVDLGTLKPKDGKVESVRWLSGVDECEWMGVSCTVGQISDIILVENNLHGTLVPELTKIEKLQGLYLINNTITGTIPAGYGSMENLLILALNRNKITGSFPAELYDLSSLQEFFLSHNSIGGTLPPPPSGSWPQLEGFILFNNSFTGPVPSEIGGLPSLERLDLAYNGFAGSIPSGLGNAQSLEQVRFENNLLNGTMPQEICNLPGLSCLTADQEEVQCECCAPNNICS